MTSTNNCTIFLIKNKTKKMNKFTKCKEHYFNGRYFEIKKINSNFTLKNRSRCLCRRRLKKKGEQNFIACHVM